MDECEALCTRLGIMKGGKLQGCKSIPAWKKEFKNGFTVYLKLKEGSELKDADDVNDGGTNSDTEKLIPESSIGESLKNRSIKEVVQTKLSEKFGTVTVLDEHGVSL